MSETVVVGSKLPHGFHLDVMTKKGKVRHTIKGTSSSSVIGGFGITEGVPKAHFDAWYKDNAAMDYVTKGLVWAYPDRASAVSRAKEMAELRHGMEPLQQEKDSRVPKNVTKDKKEDDE